MMTLATTTATAATALDQQLAELGAWAAGLELSAADPTTPYWLRRQDAERAKRIREEQLRLLAEDQERQRLEQQQPPQDQQAWQEELTRLGFHRCQVTGCDGWVAGGDVCARCKEEINGEPYPLGNILLGETFYQWTVRVLKRLWQRHNGEEAQS